MEAVTASDEILMRRASISALLSMLVMCATAWAQEAASLYPSKSVLLIDAQAAGGPADREARLYAKKLSGYFGQNFVIDSKPGAGTTIASAFVAKAKPDGYTLQIVTGSFTIFPGLYHNLPFDTLKDLTPVSLMSERTTVFITHPGFPAKSFEDYLAYARANPRKINFSALGVGSGAHLGGVWLHGATNTRVTFIPMIGSTPAQFRQFLVTDTNRNRKLMQDNGIKLNE